MQVRTSQFESCGSRQRASLWLRAGFKRSRSVSAIIAAIAAIVFALAHPAAAQIPCSYEIAAIIQGPPGPIHQSPTFATAISPDGRYVVGSFNFDAVGSNRAFCYDMKTSEFRILPLIEGTFTNTAWDVNNAGIVVGEIGGASGHWGFLFDFVTSEYTLLPSLAGVGICRVTGINEAGTVCGTRTIAGPPNYPETAFIWTQRDGFNDLGLINNKSTSAAAINSTGHVSISTGFSIDPGSLAYVWQPPMLVAVGPVPGGSTSGASDINDQGWLLTGGLIQQNPLVLAAFARSSTGQFVELPPLIGGSSAGVPAISANGVVAGHTNYQTPNFHRHACIWRDGQVVALASLVNEPFAGALESARISANEVIVANSTTNNGDLVAVVLSPVFGPPGDVTCDDSVNVSDLLKVIGSWGPCLGCDADVNRDSTVNVWDVIEVIVNWGTGGAL